MRRRAFTLLEMLIAVALVLAVGALALPALSERLAEARFDSALDRLTAHLLQTRAAALERRAPIEVRFTEADGLLESIEFTTDSARPAASDDWLFGEVGANTRAAPQWTLRATLPDGVRVVDVLPVDANAESAEGVDDSSTLVDEESADLSEAPIRIVIYLPDGSTLLAPDSWVMDAAGRRVRVTINPWTGVPTMERILAAEKEGKGPVEDEFAIEEDASGSNGRDPQEGARGEEGDEQS